MGSGRACGEAKPYDGELVEYAKRFSQMGNVDATQASRFGEALNEVEQNIAESDLTQLQNR